MIGTSAGGALRLLRHQSAPPRIGLPKDVEEPAAEVNVTNPQPETSLIRRAVVARTVTTSPYDW